MVRRRCFGVHLYRPWQLTLRTRGVDSKRASLSILLHYMEVVGRNILSQIIVKNAASDLLVSIIATRRSHGIHTIIVAILLIYQICICIYGRHSVTGDQINGGTRASAGSVVGYGHHQVPQAPQVPATRGWKRPTPGNSPLITDGV